MLTKKDFVKWRLEGPKHWPLHAEGYTYIGPYNADGDELFVNFDKHKIICKNISRETGVVYSLLMVFESPRLGSSDWCKVRKLYEAYQKCLPQPTS